MAPKKNTRQKGTNKQSAASKQASKRRRVNRSNQSPARGKNEGLWEDQDARWGHGREKEYFSDEDYRHGPYASRGRSGTPGQWARGDYQEGDFESRTYNRGQRGFERTGGQGYGEEYYGNENYSPERHRTRGRSNEGNRGRGFEGEPYHGRQQGGNRRTGSNRGYGEEEGFSGPSRRGSLYGREDLAAEERRYRRSQFEEEPYEDEHHHGRKSRWAGGGYGSDEFEGEYRGPERRKSRRNPDYNY